MSTMNMRVAISTLFLVSTFNGSNAQVLEWAKHMGGVDSYAQIEDMEVDEAGNSYTVGMYGGTYLPDPSGTPNISGVGAHSYIQKTGPEGTLKWVAYIGGGGGSAQSHSIIADQLGNVYVAGNFSNTLDFDPGTQVFNLSSLSDLDGFILKLDSNGSFVWVKGFHGDFMLGNDMVVDADDNLIVTGMLDGSVDFNPGSAVLQLTSHGMYDVFIMKMSPVGNLIWAKNFGHVSSDRGLGVAVDAQDDIYFTGYFNGGIDFDPNDPNAGHLINVTTLVNKNFVVKFSPGGQFIWVKALGSDQQGNDIDVDHSGNVYVITRSSAYSTQVVSTNLYRIRADNGQQIWYKYASGDGDEEFLGLSVSPNDNGICVVGRFTEQLQLGTYSLVAWPGTDGFLAKYDSLGTPLWLEKVGHGENQNMNYPIAVDFDQLNNTVVAGNFSLPFDFDFSSGSTMLSPYGDQDVFLFKIGCHETYATWNVTSCFEYMSPSGKFHWSSSGIYTDTILNILGCDSILQINLTVDSINTSLEVSNSAIEAHSSNDSVYWFSCDSQNVILDSNALFYPASNGYYSARLVNDNCIDTLPCFLFEFSSPSGIENREIMKLIRLFPNPTNDLLNIHALVSIDQIALFDARGVLLKRLNVAKENEVQVTLAGLPDGLYFVRIKAGSEIVNVRVLKL